MHAFVYLWFFRYLLFVNKTFFFDFINFSLYDNLHFFVFLIVYKKSYNLVVQVLVYGRELIDDWVKYRIQIESVFKRNPGTKVRRGLNALWMPSSTIECKCPKIKVGRRYLLMGNYSKIFDQIKFYKKYIKIYGIKNL